VWECRERRLDGNDGNDGRGMNERESLWKSDNEIAVRMAVRRKRGERTSRLKIVRDCM
jgi:hypothetical protein